MDHVIVRYGEIGIKGKNRGHFEKILAENIKRCLNREKIPFKEINRLRGRILIETEGDCSCLQDVFGIVSFSPAIKTEITLNRIKQTALSFYEEGKFRVSTQRLDKDIDHSSQKMNEVIGDVIVNEKKGVVDLKNPDIVIGIELFNNSAFIFSSRINGLGGLPVGVEEKVTLLAENEDSLLAGVLMMKRGCFLEVINNNKLDLTLLMKYSPQKIGVVQKPSNDSNGLVVGERLDSMKDYKFNVFRPLIGYGNKELCWIKI